MKISELPWSFPEPRPHYPELYVTGVGQDGDLAAFISEGVSIVFSALPDSLPPKSKRIWPCQVW